jgi:hypothetical protein
VVTGAFDTPLRITGAETRDITVTLSFSVNKSFEWVDTNSNGQWDLQLNNNTDPADDVMEPVVDMGLRGLIPTVTY